MKNKKLKEALGQKTPGADSLYQRMTSIKKATKPGAQRNGEDIQKELDIEDEKEDSTESDEFKDNKKLKEYEIMLQRESRRKKLGLDKWSKTKK